MYTKSFGKSQALHKCILPLRTICLSLRYGQSEGATVLKSGTNTTETGKDTQAQVKRSMKQN